MPPETATTDERDDPETMTVTSEVKYEIEQEAIRQIDPNVTIHRIVGDSELDRVLVSSDPDSDDRSDRMVFGYHEDELPAPL